MIHLQAPNLTVAFNSLRAKAHSRDRNVKLPLP